MTIDVCPERRGVWLDRGELDRLLGSVARWERLRAAAAGPEQLATLLGARVPADEWPAPDLGEILPMLVDRCSRQPQLSRWMGLMVHKKDRAVIGDIGFKDPPGEAGTVEVGYSVIPSYRRQGYATEALKAVVNWALGQPRVRQVLAECEHDNAASIRVLEKAGLRCVRRDDALLYWETGAGRGN